MKLGVIICLVVCGFATQTFAALNLVCYYDSASYIREGLAKLAVSDLEVALQFCTHFIYGYVGLNPETFKLASLHPELDIQKRHFATVTFLKEKYPHIKFLLSVGGDKDLGESEKYIKLLEASKDKQANFIESVRGILRSYNFDGIDLAFQLPRNKPRKVHSSLGMAWKSVKKFFTGDFIVDENAQEHREQLTNLVKDLRNAIWADEFMLSLTVLPNVNSSWYYDAPAIINYLDFVNLAVFDFLTPDRNPDEADYTAPLFELNDQNRLSHYNVNYQIEHWLLQRVPSSKLNVGIATYGRAWKTSEESGRTGVPVVTATKGPAPMGSQSRMPGLLSWPETCALLTRSEDVMGDESKLPLRSVDDPLKRNGTYAFREPDENGEHGLWVTYEDPDTAANKAGYVKAKNLGGVALFDLSFDDFRGLCSGQKFPITRAIKYRLL